MGVDILVGDQGWEIGAASFLHSFFSTVSAHLEPGGWGTRFPALMHRLYKGHLPVAEAGQARRELDHIRRELERFPPSAVVWDIEDRSKTPPWGDNISPQVTSLANYFVTSNGRDLFAVVAEALDESERSGYDAVIQ